MMSEVFAVLPRYRDRVLVLALRQIASVIQDAGALDGIAADAAIELHAADRRQVVALGIEEQVLEQVLRRVLGRRLARTHHPVDLDQRLEPRTGRIDAQRVGDVRTAIQIVDVQRADLRDPGLDQLLDSLGGQLVVGLGQQLAGLGVDDVVGEDLALEIGRRHDQGRGRGLLQYRGRGAR